MRLITIVLLLISSVFYGQKALPFDTLQIKEVNTLLADDYGSIYLYKNKDFSFAKYDSLGKMLGELRLTLPHKIQDIQNPLNVVLFSENAQEVKLVDQNLVEIQKVSLTGFGFIKMAYVEDQQQMWLLDAGTKRLLQYRFRQDAVLQAFPVPFRVEDVKDMIIYDQKIYVLTEQLFEVYNFKGTLLHSSPVVNGKRLRRENDDLLIICGNAIFKFSKDAAFTELFSKDDTAIVDKNNAAYYEVRDNKIYLYPVKNSSNTEAD